MRNIKRISYVIVGLMVMLVSSCSSSEDTVEDIRFDINTDYVLLKKEGGVAYLNVSSNTKWTLLVNNEDVPVKDLSVTPLSGNGDETIKITYGSEVGQYPYEHATLTFYYYSGKDRVSKEVILSRSEKVDEDDGWTPRAEFVKSNHDFPTTFTTLGGYKLISNKNDFIDGNMFLISYQYKESSINEETKSIQIELLADPLCVDASTKVGSINEYPSNAAVKDILYEGATPVFYEKDILIIPVVFYIHGTTSSDLKEELKRHSFELVYDSSINTGTDLKLKLRYLISGENVNRTNLTIGYKAYDLKSIISLFGKKPKNVIIEYQKNSVSGDLNASQKSTFSLNYNF